MGQAMLNGVYDSQSGPRGDDKAFVVGHGDGHGHAASCRRRHGCSFRAMLAPTR